MGKQQGRPSDFHERMLTYMLEERANLVADIQRGDAKAVEDRKRLRRLEREIEILSGGAL